MHKLAKLLWANQRVPCVTLSHEQIETAKNLYHSMPYGELATLEFSLLDRKAGVMDAEISH